MQNRIDRILEEIHPYKIYNNSKTIKGQWATYVPDPTKPSGRRAMKRNSLEALHNAIVMYYKKSSHLDMPLQAFFAKWVLFRRDETAVKPATIRRDMSLWKTHIRDIFNHFYIATSTDTDDTVKAELIDTPATCPAPKKDVSEK